MSATRRQAFWNHPEKLPVGILPFLLAQAGLDDAAALLGNLPEHFIGDGLVQFSGTIVGRVNLIGRQDNVDKRFNRLADVTRKAGPSVRDPGNRRR